MWLRIWYNKRCEALIAFFCLKRSQPKVVVVDLDNDLARPYFFLNESIAVVNADDEVDGSAENERLVFSDVEVKEEGVLGGGIEAEGKSFLLDSFHLYRVGVDFVDAETEFSWIDKHDPEFLDFQKLIIFNSDTVNIEDGQGGFILVYYFLLHLGQFVCLWRIVRIFQFVFFEVIDFADGSTSFLLCKAGEDDGQGDGVTWTPIIAFRRIEVSGVVDGADNHDGRQEGQ